MAGVNVAVSASYVVAAQYSLRPGGKRGPAGEQESRERQDYEDGQLTEGVAGGLLSHRVPLRGTCTNVTKPYVR
jgi:hypothetical protein